MLAPSLASKLVLTQPEWGNRQRHNKIHFLLWLTPAISSMWTKQQDMHGTWMNGWAQLLSRTKVHDIGWMLASCLDANATNKRRSRVLSRVLMMQFQYPSSIWSRDKFCMTRVVSGLKSPILTMDPRQDWILNQNPSTSEVCPVEFALTIPSWGKTSGQTLSSYYITLFH